MGVQIPGKKRYVTLEWPLMSYDRSHLCKMRNTNKTRVTKAPFNSLVSLIIRLLIILILVNSSMQ